MRRSVSRRPAAREAPRRRSRSPSRRVKKADFSVYLNGLGTVQPFDTVTVRSRVDGQIIKVAFKQGQMVKEGDTLVRNRSAALSGGARPGAVQEGAGRGQPEERPAQPRALRSAWPRRITPRSSRSTRSRRPSISSPPRSRAIRRRSTMPRRSSATRPSSRRCRDEPGFRLVDPGNIVHASDQNGIVTIVQLQPISVVFTAPEENVPQINKALEEGSRPGGGAELGRPAGRCPKAGSRASTTRSTRRAAPSA